MSEYSQWDIERIEQAAYRSGVNNAGREWAREVSTLQARIAELEAENERMKEERRWIPVSERLPEDCATVLTAFENREILTATYYKHHEGFGGVENYWHIEGWHSGNVTHWMPLPKLPEVQE